jgi:hypothetical protein
MDKPRIEFHSSGESGNIYALIASVGAALKCRRRVKDYTAARDRVLQSGSYREALGILRETVDLIDLDGAY